MSKSVKFKGKIISGRTDDSIANKLGVKGNTQIVRDLRNGINTTRVLVNNAGDFEKIDIREDPVLLRSFGDIKREGKKKLVLPSSKIKNINLFDDVPTDLSLNAKLIITFRVEISGGTLKKFRFEKDSRGSFDNFNDRSFLEDTIFKWLSDNDIPHTGVGSVDYVNVEVKNRRNVSDLSLNNGKLNRYNNIDIRENIGNLIDFDPDIKNNCFTDYILSKNKVKKEIPVINKLFDIDGADTYKCCCYLIDRNHPIQLYQITGDPIWESKPAEGTQRPAIRGISYNGHFYPIKGSYKKYKPLYGEVIATSDIKSCFKSIYNDSNVLPGDVKLRSFGLSSFVYDGKKYIGNHDYYKCKEILNKIDKKILFDDDTNLGNIIGKVEKHFNDLLLNNNNNVDSFLPRIDKYVKGGYNYSSSLDESRKKFIRTIDKNKCYLWCLCDLSHLIKVDYRNCNISFNVDKCRIVDHYLYIVECDKSSILIPNNGVYVGEHLKYCLKQGIDFIIKEEMETEYMYNHISDIIKKLLKVMENDDFKKAGNTFIGKFERCNEKSERNNLLKICNKEEKRMTDGYEFFEKIDDDIYALINSEKFYVTKNRKPISIQIKDRSRRLLHEKMKELNLKSSDILCVNTDSITFYDEEGRDITLNPKDFNGWKGENKKIDSLDESVVYNLETPTFFNSYDGSNDNLYIDSYAGCGKTYYIKNVVLPSLKDYVVLTPSHSTLKTYKEDGYNCNVIQAYGYNRPIPKESTIIIDEHGLLGKRECDIIYKCHLSGKRIISAGDYKQLLPPNEYTPLNSCQYIDMIFNRKEVLKTNHRNNFSISYYDNLIQSTDKDYLYEEIKKHSTATWEEADVVISYHKSVRDNYNNLKLEHLGYSSMIESGVKIICKTNNLRSKDIYNNFIFHIKSVSGDEVELDCGIKISREKVENNFIPAYSTTIYGIQGSGINSYYYPDDDKDKVDSRLAYTLISRLVTGDNHYLSTS